MDKYFEWNNTNEFQGPCTINTDDGYTYHIQNWYAQPAMHSGRPIQYIIDPHHLYVNNRVRCCKHGMEGMGIHASAWRKVAEEERDNQAGLSVELVIELRDKQRNEFAQATFSEKVEKAMLLNGNTAEANWCLLIRNWYKAIDEGGVPLHQRLRWLLDMREFLLRHFSFAQFPPPGLFIKGMSLVQFEGILCNIDRRIQLYTMVSGNTYNQRAISSLDSETMFSSFQDLDPKGQGVLRPDDIPTALGTALCLLHHRLDGNRSFEMKTSRKRVYPEHELDDLTTDTEETDVEGHTDGTWKSVYCKSHAFDLPSRANTNPKRKRSRISKTGECSVGATGVRAFHKVNEEAILPHRRECIKDEDMP